MQQQGWHLPHVSAIKCKQTIEDELIFSIPFLLHADAKATGISIATSTWTANLQLTAPNQSRQSQLHLERGLAP